jgi:hypothetical protein
LAGLMYFSMSAAQESAQSQATLLLLSFGCSHDLDALCAPSCHKEEGPEELKGLGQEQVTGSSPMRSDSLDPSNAADRSRTTSKRAMALRACCTASYWLSTCCDTNLACAWSLSSSPSEATLMASTEMWNCRHSTTLEIEWQVDDWKRGEGGTMGLWSAGSSLGQKPLPYPATAESRRACLRSRR